MNKKMKFWKVWFRFNLILMASGTLILMSIKNGFFIATFLMFIYDAMELNHIQIMEKLNNE